MSRLVTFGCSHTDGFGVGYNESQNWPQVLGRLLTVDEVVNLAKAGASIKEIAFNIDNYKPLKGDIVIVLWTHQHRYCKVEPNKTIKRINPWFEKELSENYYKNFHTKVDDQFQSRAYILSSTYTLKNKVKKIFYGFADKPTYCLVEKDLPVSMCFKKPFYEGYKQYGTCHDNKHLGVLANFHFANEMYEFIKGNFTSVV